MIIEKRVGNTVELELEIRDIQTNELVDLSLYDLTSQLSDGMGGVVVMPLSITLITGASNKGRCLLVVTGLQTANLFPAMYEINTNYVERSTSYSESMKTIFLELTGL